MIKWLPPKTVQIRLIPSLSVFLLLVSGIAPIFSVQAIVSSCSANVDPSGIITNATNPLTFTFTNTSSVTVTWVKITSPSNDYEVVGGSAGGWDASLDSSRVITFTGSVASGNSVDFTVNTRTGSTAVSASNYVVKSSDTVTGDDPVTCTGNLAVAIGDPFSISDITVTNITTTTATITWTSSAAASSVVKYGLDAFYASTSSDSGLVTSHTVALSGLNPDTTYHYRVKSISSQGVVVQSADNTFLTEALASSSSDESGDEVPFVNPDVPISQPISPTQVPHQKVFVTPEPEVDVVRPIVELNFDFSKAYPDIPELTGQARDNTGVTDLDYSIDDGVNWLPVEGVVLGGKLVNFKFRPEGISEGNFQIKIRAFDQAQNLGLSQSYTLVIDKIPPLVGGIVYSVGPQLLLPQNDFIYALAGLDQRVTLASIGGATSINLLASKDNQKQVFSLTKNKDSGLWSGALAFSEPGVYSLTAVALDGASNRTERSLSRILVLENGRVTSGSKAVTEAMVSVYYYNHLNQNFSLWDGRMYGQMNPQKVKEDGSYGFVLPAGRYYLDVKANGYQTLRTNMFTLTKSEPVSEVLTLLPNKLTFFTMPDFRGEAVKTRSLDTLTATYQNSLGSSDLASLLGQRLTAFLDPLTPYLGQKPMIVSFITSWQPDAAVQLDYLETLKQQNRASLITVAVLPMESDSAVNVLKQRGNYNLDLIPDPDGLSVKNLNVSLMPTHVFVNKKGTIQKIKFGVLTASELKENLLN